MARTSEPALGHRAVLHQRRRQRVPRLQAPSPNGWGYCVFGKVIARQDVVDRIRAVPTGNSGFHQNVPKEDVVIVKAEEQ